MNIFIGILLLCALLGLWDKISGGKMGLAAEFDGGLASMASLALSIVGIYCIGVTAVRSNPEAIASFASRLPFDASVLIGSLLAPDLGGHAIAKELAATPALGIYSGVMVSSCLGALISFTLPIALTVIRREDTSLFMQGSVWGIVTIPAGVAVGALLTGLPVKELVRNLLPILLLCAGICLALIKAAEATIRVLSVVGNLVRIASLVLFALVMLGLFLPACQIASDTLIFESLTIVVKIAVVVAGSMVAASLILRFFQKGISRIAGWLGVNSYSVVGLIISLATCISMIPMMEKMGRPGKGDERGLCSQRFLCAGRPAGLHRQCGAAVGGICLYCRQAGGRNLRSGRRHGVCTEVRRWIRGTGIPGVRKQPPVPAL